MSKLDRFLSEVSPDIETLEDLETFENLDRLEHFARKQNNVSALHAIAQTKRAMAQRKAGAGLSVQKGRLGVYQGTGNVAAMFEIQITRVSANINKALKVALFATSPLESGYGSILSNDAGVTLDYIAIGRDNSGLTNATRARYSFTEGANTDYVDVTCSQVPYPEFLSAIRAGDSFKMDQIQYNISDSTQTSQYNQAITAFERSMFGKYTQQTINPNTFRSSGDFKNDIVEMKGIEWNVGKEEGIITGIIPVAGFSVSLTGFVTGYHRGGVSELR